MQTIFPVIRYTNARAAIDWLCRVLGSEVLFSVPESGEFIRHAQLKLGTNIIMVGSVRDDGISSPAAVGISTQALCVYVKDVESFHARVVAADPTLTCDMATTDFGAVEFFLSDPEGHQWTFSSYRPGDEQ